MPSVARKLREPCKSILDVWANPATAVTPPSMPSSSALASSRYRMLWSLLIREAVCVPSDGLPRSIVRKVSRLLVKCKGALHNFERAGKHLVSMRKCLRAGVRTCLTVSPVCPTVGRTVLSYLGLCWRGRIGPIWDDVNKLEPGHPGAPKRNVVRSIHPDTGSDFQQQLKDKVGTQALSTGQQNKCEAHAEKIVL